MTLNSPSLRGGVSAERRTCWIDGQEMRRSAETPLRPRLLIVGVGNLLMGDDGVGVHAIQALQREPIPGVTMVEIGTAILHGLSFVEAADRVLVIDAAKGGQAPGTIYLFDATEETETKAVSSIHALGLREAMCFLSRAEPPPVTVIGVEPLTLDYRMELSSPVQAALPRVVALARQTVSDWRREAAPMTAPAGRPELLPA